MYFVTKDGVKKGKANELMALRFWAGNLANSAAYRRNKILSESVIRDLVGEKALVYRSAQGKNIPFKISEQKLAIAHKIMKKDNSIILSTPDFQLTTVFDAKDLPITAKHNPILVFDPDESQEVTRLTSDEMIGIIVDKMKIEPDQAQTTLEQFYWSGWINYPRTDVTKVEESHVYPLEGKQLADFKGTLPEKKALEIIFKAEEAYNEGRNYKQLGKWILYNDKTEKKKLVLFEGTRPYKLPEDQDVYSHQAFDIDIGVKGNTAQSITQFMKDNDIGTPATRTVQFTEMKEAGLIKKLGDYYAVDSRGLILGATYDFYLNNSWTAIDLRRKLSQKTTPKELIDVLSVVQTLELSKIETVKAHILQESVYGINGSRKRLSNSRRILRCLLNGLSLIFVWLLLNSVRNAI